MKTNNTRSMEEKKLRRDELAAELKQKHHWATPAELYALAWQNMSSAEQLADFRVMFPSIPDDVLAKWMADEDKLTAGFLADEWTAGDWLVDDAPPLDWMP